MVEKSQTAGGEDAAGDLRGTLLRRLAVAAVLVAILLAVLAFFDYLASTPEEAETPVFTQPVPVAPRKEISQPVTKADGEVPATSVAPPPEPPPEPPPAPVPAPPVAEPVVSPPAAAGTGNGEAAPRRTSKPIHPVPAAVERSAPAVSARPATPAAPVAEETAPPDQLVANTRILPARPAEPAAPRLFSGFLLQAGVFSSVQRAEELHAKLTLSGVPSTLETRVQIGPFRTRKEAEAAQARLKELGVQTLLVAPTPRH